MGYCSQEISLDDNEEVIERLRSEACRVTLVGEIWQRIESAVTDEQRECVALYLVQNLNIEKKIDYDNALLHVLASDASLNRFKAVLRDVVDKEFQALHKSAATCAAIAFIPSLVAGLEAGAMTLAIAAGTTIFTPAVVPILIVAASLLLVIAIALIVKRCFQSQKIRRLRHLRDAVNGKGLARIGERKDPHDAFAKGLRGLTTRFLNHFKPNRQHRVFAPDAVLGGRQPSLSVASSHSL